MNDLTKLANIAEIVGALIVVGGLIFAVLQMRQTRQQRRELAAIELFRFIGNPRFATAYKQVLRMPNDLSATDIENDVSDLDEAAMLISTTMESIGVMIFQRIVPFVVVKNLMGSSVPELWRKLAPWISMLRQEQDSPGLFEWFQWLAERIEQGPLINDDPAYIAHKSWIPSNMTNEI